jgi:hypothetical protein
LPRLAGGRWLSSAQNVLALNVKHGLFKVFVRTGELLEKLLVQLFQVSIPLAQTLDILTLPLNVCGPFSISLRPIMFVLVGIKQFLA